jgi:hypothetical protein
MGTENDPPEIYRKIVVTFDICSSTLVIEDLHKTENTIKWRNFLIWMEKYLRTKANEYGFMVYKFTGDGWILMFDFDTSGEDLINFLQGLCHQFKMRFTKKVEDYLETPPLLSGLTFGIDRGSLIGFVMNQQMEYVGRAINVACRLQSSIKDKDKSPQYKAIITKPLFQEIRRSLKNIKQQDVKRKLRNIAGDKDVRCIKIWLEPKQTG